MNDRSSRSQPVRALIVVGTRPEAIKLAPVIRACRRRDSGIEPLVCFTGQHREMLAQVAEYFSIEPDLDLDLMRRDQTLNSLAARCLEGLDAAIVRHTPDCIVAQGDTTSVMAASIAAHYRRTPFVHVEAGLRTGDLSAPWPEEFNRRVAAISASLHCAPTRRAADNLHREGVPPGMVHVTGNTVIDALLWTVARERRRSHIWQEKFAFLKHPRLVLITGHRRENFGSRFDTICDTIRRLSERHEDVDFLYPVHLNPHVQEPVFRTLRDRPNIHLTAPSDYPAFVWLMDRAHLIITDSGGVQEEAPSLKKPVLVTRETTERPEAVEAGAVELVGASAEHLFRSVERLLGDPEAYRQRQLAANPYGDGRAAARIVELLAQRAWEGGASAAPAAEPLWAGRPAVLRTGPCEQGREGGF
jgi:UDP-N-acetylglucosamine 2-epimerase (non-hydrolysing)